MPAVLKPLFAGLAFLLAAPAPVQTGPVSQAEFQAMLVRAQGGGVIDLGKRRVDFGQPRFQPSKPVTIKGGVFGPAYLQDWRNVTFDGAAFEGPPGTSDNQFLFVAYGADNVTLRNCRFTGHELPNGDLQVRGPSFRESTNVAIEHCLIEKMAGFSNFARTNGARFVDNDVRMVREGLEVVGGSNIVIERNRFEDFRPAEGDHPDAMQFFTSGLTRPGDTATRGVTIRDNLVLGNSKAQGVFATDQIGMAAKGLGYRDFTVENNVIVSATWHGITASEVENVTVRGNKLYKLAGDPYASRVGVVGSTGAVNVSDNDADDFIFAGEARQSRNRKHGPVDKGTIDAIVADWMARFRKS